MDRAFMSPGHTNSSWRGLAALQRGDAVNARPGYCATTLLPGNCSTGSSGFWPARLNRIKSLDDCIAKCQQCPRCSTVSLSLARAHSECSWYSACDLSDLRRPPRTGKDYTTVYVKPAARMLPPAVSTRAQRHLTVSIATVCAGIGSRCALVQWCERALKLAQALQWYNGWRVRLIVITGDQAGSGWRAADGPDPGDCAQATFVPSDVRVTASVDSCDRRNVAAKVHRQFGGWQRIAIQRWQLYSRTQDDYVICSDVDVDLFAEGQQEAEDVARRWATLAVPGGHKPWVHLVANADHSSPLNTGVMVLRPSMWLFEDGLRVLQACTWNHTHGWQLVGPPDRLGIVPTHPDGVEVARDVMHRPKAGDPLAWTKAWRFAFSSSDQGFFWYMLYVRHRLGAYFRLKANRHRVLHWWGTTKPWRTGFNTSLENVSSRAISKTYTYLLQSAMPAGGSANATTCQRLLFSLRQRIEDDARFDSLPSWPLGQYVPYSYVWR